MVIVPRHPERFDDVANLCKQHNFSVVRRSEKASVNVDSDIWLLDSLGELMSIYAEATIVTMGGSFSSIGGHNPLEPALFRKPVIVGPRMDNFNEVFEQLQTESGIVQLLEGNYASDLAKAVISLNGDVAKAKKLGDNAYNVVKRNQGATDTSIKDLSHLLEPMA